ncbi:hypothetical protein GCM10009555_088170 [Acrocarpospora macrocephala]|uniref:PknH-like extracellular domain-containing protein n=2 Tax=Acrocarpospora macrocephala TaxID=150177 RepID=A0A5M3X7Y2_9ACTN|nr:hypothetical protein Amac_103800 [Acrocarpospora macrocephala]
MIKRLILGPVVAALTAICLTAPAAAAPIPPLNTAEIKAALLSTSQIGAGYEAKKARYSLVIPLKATYPTAACNKALKAYDKAVRGRPVTTITFRNEETVTAVSHAVVTGTPTFLNSIANGAKAIGRYCHGLRPKSATDRTKIVRKAVPNLGQTTSAFRFTEHPDSTAATFDVVFIRYRSALAVVQRVSIQTEDEWPQTVAIAKKAAAKLKAVYAKRG